MKNIIGLRNGKTVRTTETPEIIKRSELPIQLSFIRGFFDAEGTVGESTKNPYLEIGQASKDEPCEILLWISNKLSEIEIFLNKPQKCSYQEFFRLRTARRENIKRFFEVVSSEHPEKIIKFEKILEKCKTN